MTVVTRFAPSPTGELHLGSAYSAWTGWHRAREAGGTFLVRIEDIDIRRCKREFETAILDDLKWLGFDWDGEVRRQSEHFADYGKALDQLDARGLIYPCFCSRAAIERELAASANAPHGPDGPLYPGTCRHLSRAGAAGQRSRRARSTAFASTPSARRGEAGPYHFVDETLGRVEGEPLLMGDFVIARKDTPTSYHLAVTVDDHLQGITLVTRGVDVLPSTHVHGLLQKLLGYETPRYAHHKLLTDASGRRFAKRDRDMTIRAMRESGMTPARWSNRLFAGGAPLQWRDHDDAPLEWRGPATKISAMNRQEELAVGRRLLGHIDGRTTDLADAMFRNRVSAYSCRERAGLERDRLFRERPIFMGLSTRLPKPGDYLTEDVAGMPVLMTRGADGEVRAFANICRHRGAPVAQGCGNARAFVCPYHGWTYDSAGKLLGTTDKVGFAGIDLASHGLVRLPAAERHGLMFVRPKPIGAGESGAIDIDADLGALVPDLAALRAGDLSDLLGRPRRAAHQLEVRHRHLPRGLSHPASAPEDDRAVLHRQCRHVRRRRPARPHVRGAHLDRRACGACPRASATTARTSSRSTSSSPTPS